MFKCPKCGGYMFGTSNATDWDNAFGHCHDFDKDGKRCSYTWHRKSQDKDVMVEVSLQ